MLPATWGYSKVAEMKMNIMGLSRPMKVE